MGKSRAVPGMFIKTFTSKLIKTEEYHMVLVEEAIDLILRDKAST
ncbi:MAG: hypothetical protein V3R86_05055 [Candidatus Hydrothermarchaeaceae archaeon]